MFKNFYAAESFARDYLEMDERIWADPREVAIYELLAQAIRHALDKKILTAQDLFSNDETVMSILKSKGDNYIQKKLAYLTPSFRIELATKTHYHLYIRTKMRYVDPKIVTSGSVRRLSQLSNKFKQILDEHKKYRKSGWYVDVYKN